jgi:plastocyanin
MTRLAGMTSLYALIAALLLVTPLSASQDSVPEPAAPQTAEQAQDAVPEPSEPAPTVPEPIPPEAAPADTTPPPEPVAPAEPTPLPDPTTLPEPTPVPAETAVQEPGQPVPARRKSRRSADAPRATAAADTGVTISDFEFAPASVTINVGDTVTWTNDGPTPHSATADDGSFDTGIFNAGQSRSETFDQAGTFAYFCTPHPNMRGTITVQAAASGNGSGGGGGTTGGEAGATGESGTTGSGGATTGDSAGSGLPATGLDAGGLALLGLVTLALGAFLRRRAASAG